MKANKRSASASPLSMGFWRGSTPPKDKQNTEVVHVSSKETKGTHTVNVFENTQRFRNGLGFTTAILAPASSRHQASPVLSASDLQSRPSETSNPHHAASDGLHADEISDENPSDATSEAVSAVDSQSASSRITRSLGNRALFNAEEVSDESTLRIHRSVSSPELRKSETAEDVDDSDDEQQETPIREATINLGHTVDLATPVSAAKLDAVELHTPNVKTPTTGDAESCIVDPDQPNTEKESLGKSNNPLDNEQSSGTRGRKIKQPIIVQSGPRSTSHLSPEDLLNFKEHDIDSLVDAIMDKWAYLDDSYESKITATIQKAESLAYTLVSGMEIGSVVSLLDANEKENSSLPPTPTFKEETEPGQTLHWQEWKSRLDSLKSSQAVIIVDPEGSPSLQKNLSKPPRTIVVASATKADDTIVTSADKINDQEPVDKPTSQAQITPSRTASQSGFFGRRRPSENNVATLSAMQDLQIQKIKYQEENQDLKETVDHLREMLAAKTERCLDLERANTGLMQELEDLTKSLFEEANKMVSQANRSAFEKDAENKLLLTKLSQQALTLSILENELEYERTKKYQQSLDYLTGSFMETRSLPKATTPSLKLDLRPVSVMDRWPQVCSDLLLKEFDDFIRPHQANHSRKLDEHPFMKRIIKEDIEPSIEAIGRSGFRKDVLHSMKSRSLELKLTRGSDTPVSVDGFQMGSLPSTPKTPGGGEDVGGKSSLLAKSFNFVMQKEAADPMCALCQHAPNPSCRMRLSTGDRWLVLDRYCYEKLSSAYRLYLLCMQIFEGDDRPIMEIFQQVTQERLRVFFARIMPPQQEDDRMGLHRTNHN